MTVTFYKEGAGSESQIVSGRARIQTQVSPPPPLSSLMVTKGSEGITEGTWGLF